MARGPSRTPVRKTTLNGDGPERSGVKRRGREEMVQEITAAKEPQGKKPRLLESRSWASCVPGDLLSLGQGDTGQLGLGEDVLERTKPGFVKDIPEKVTEVAAGGMHTVCLTVSGKVHTFGCNDEGALGRQIDEEEDGFKPGIVQVPGKVIQVTAGDSHCAALTDSGKAFYWGTFRDSSGSLGLTPDGVIQRLPVALAHHLDVKKISSGTDHIALLTADGELYTMGCGEQGQLGRVGQRCCSRGSRRGLSALLTPDKVHTKNRRTTFIDVWAGSYNTLALTTNNEVLACGLNNYNQLGIDRGLALYSFVRSPGFTEVIKQGTTWSDVVFGQHHALGLDSNGRVHAVGRVDYGRLGLGDESTDGGKRDAKIPTHVKKLNGKKCVGIGCGTAVSFAVMANGECYSWGMCTNGQLGHEDDEKDAWVPKNMLGKQLETRNVVCVSGGGQHTMLIASPKQS